MARPHSAPREGVWDTAIEHGVHTSNSAVHMLPELCDYKEKIQTLSVSGE